MDEAIPANKWRTIEVQEVIAFALKTKVNHYAIMEKYKF